MSTRYLTNISLAVLGGFLLVTSQAFASGTFGWLMLGAGIVAAAVAAPGVAIPARGGMQRGLDYLGAVIGAWTIVASLVFSGLTVTWLGFASGGAFAVLALIGLTIHELSTERVVHSLEVKSSDVGVGDPDQSSERSMAGIR